jgi:myo-inositol-1(or 4)-monophosphatase
MSQFAHPSLSPQFWTTVFTCAQTVCHQVGERLLTEIGQVEATEKRDGSLVTDSDQWADHQIRMAITAIFPDHGILSEEGNHIYPDQDWCWIIDPIDGTTNFAHGIPLWGISIGLLYQGMPVFGYVHVPTLQQTFHGFWQAPGRPDGAFLNGQPVRTTPAQPGSNEFFSLCARSISVLQKPFPCKIRMLGSASYNFLTVAAGWMLGAIEATPKIWDLAAVWVILQAAGAVWVPVKSRSPFPVQVGQSYGAVSFPTLVVSQPSLVETFLPLVEHLG